MQNNKPENVGASLKKLIHTYLKKVGDSKKVSEVEVRFGVFDPHGKEKSLSKKAISKVAFENVVKTIRAAGFTIIDSVGQYGLPKSGIATGPLGKSGLGLGQANPSEQYMLRIFETLAVKQTNSSERFINSDTRLEIHGLDAIQRYCTFNAVDKVLDTTNGETNLNLSNVFFTQKLRPFHDDADRDSLIMPVNLYDYNYRVSYKTEENFSLASSKAKDILGRWPTSKKLFRFLKRFRFSHPTIPVFVDFSIVKTNEKSGVIPVPTNTIQQARVFSNQESYEIEVELNNDAIQQRGLQVDEILAAMRQTIHVVLCGLQNSNFPVSYVEQDRVLSSYMQLIYTEKFPEQYMGRPLQSTDFFGPSSDTLLVENLWANTKINVLSKYSVTDKADGDRKLLFVWPVEPNLAKLYLIDTNLNATYTGQTTTHKELFYLLLDGEHILYDRLGHFLNQYAAFDIYFMFQRKDDTKVKDEIAAVRQLPFIKTDEDREEEKKTGIKKKYRYSLLKQAINQFNEAGTTKKQFGDEVCPLLITAKEFQSLPSIFASCEATFNRSEFLTYNTDGIIFTPCSSPAYINPSKNRFKSRWAESFKWKPSQYNTIDFLVTTQKDAHGQDVELVNFEAGQDLTGNISDKTYKVIELLCGVDKVRDRFKNPFLHVLKNDIVKSKSTEDSYVPERFQPTIPFDPLAYLAYIPISQDETGLSVMRTEAGEIFGQGTIVEFAYDMTGNTDNPWRWKPLRVRYELTAALLSGQRIYGNDISTANKNWRSIHNAVSRDMLITGLGIPQENTDIYYDKESDSHSDQTKPLRAFHNIVKKRLIVDVAASASGNNAKTLIDLAVGKAGDLYKWTQAKLDFVLGVDISRDNIMNEKDGACVRYLEFKTDVKTPLRAMFVVGDSGKNIRSGAAIATSLEKDIVGAIFGTKEEMPDLGKYNNVAKLGFQITSCQFAIHYFFKNASSMHGFLRNVAECTALGGYFIGTTYDGRRVFEELEKYEKGAGISFFRGKSDEPIYRITKHYDETGFPDDAQSLGYSISVFQDSIGKEFEEYLVNFEFFKRMMEDYGFVLTTKTDGEFRTGTGFFEEIYHTMMNELKKNPQLVEYRLAKTMQPDEQFISFLNRYFIFQKVREVDTELIQKKIALFKEEKEEKVAEPSERKTRITKKLSKQIVLHTFTPIEDEELPSGGEKTAIIVPYREQAGQKRREQLDAFMEYMTDYLKDYPYKIFIMEQTQDGKKFNRGKLLNIGFKEALKEGYDRFVLHDVDLLPSPDLLSYYVSEPLTQPIHLAHVWKDRYCGDNYFGGVTAFNKETFENVNGFNNDIFGWGAEDDLLYARVKEMKYGITVPTKGSYQDLENLTLEAKLHKLKADDLKCPNKWEIKKEHKHTWKTNGLNSLEFTLIGRERLGDHAEKVTAEL
jgi:hypothetical protein